jgi:DNA-binding LytR/AlgR family response regulator
MTAPITALIAEDEPLLAAALAAELRRQWPQLELLPIAPNGPQALERALAEQPDLCFLDIRMPGLDGLEVAQALIEDWPEDGRPLPLLVFVTAYDRYALQAFEAQAVDYLLKPVEPARLEACLGRLRQRLAEREPIRVDAALPAEPSALAPLLQQLLQQQAATTPRLEVIQAQIGSTLHLVPVEQVLYFEAADKYVRAVTAQRELLLRSALRELLPQLDPQRFWPVHRGTVVQARAIATAARDEAGRLWLTLHDRPERLAVSRLHAGRFRGM